MSVEGAVKMRDQDAGNIRIFIKTIAISLGLACIYWIVEAFAETYLFRHGNSLSSHLFSSEAHIILHRFLIITLFIASGIIYGFLILERKRKERELYRLLLTDDLTGVYNRRGFFTLAEHIMKLAKRRKKRVLLLYADLDDLKGINDRFGHREGDAALTAMGKILKMNCRESDIVARIGGDEFVVLLIETTRDCFQLVTDRMKENLELHNTSTKKDYGLMMSFGTSIYDPDSPLTIDELLARADKSMYAKKTAEESD